MPTKTSLIYKINLLVLLCLLISFSSGCNKWKRVKKIQTFVLAQVYTNPHINIFNENETKNAPLLSQTKTNKNLKKYNQDLAQDVLIVTKENLKMKKFKPILKNLKFEEKRSEVISKQILSYTKANGLLAITNKIGYIQTKDTKQLASKITIHISDKKGYIGKKELLIKSNTIKPLNKNNNFTQNECKALLEKTKKALTTQLQLLSL